MKDFENTKSIVKRWNLLLMLWPITKTDAERKDILIAIADFEEHPGRIMRNELMDICDDIANIQTYFDVWLNILCKIDTRPLKWPDGWKEFDEQSEEWQELWCNAIDRINGFTVEVSYEIGYLVNTYNVTPKREIPKALCVAIEAVETTETDGVAQLVTDGEISDFRAKYEGLIKDMESFLNDIHAMKPRDLAKVYKKQIKPSLIPLTEFWGDVEKITAERKGQRGWNYNAIVKY